MNHRSFLRFLGQAPLSAPCIGIASLAVAPKLTESGADVWRQHVIRDQPSSGLHYPSKAAIRQWCIEIEAALDLKPSTPPRVES